MVYPDKMFCSHDSLLFAFRKFSLMINLDPFYRNLHLLLILLITDKENICSCCSCNSLPEV